MMTADELKEMYRGMVDQPIVVRRYTGLGPTATKPKFDAPVMGNAKPYGTKELVGSIQQGDQRVIVLVEDLIERQFALPVTAADKVVVEGREIAIIAPGPRKALDGTLIAYELQCRG